ncbi:MAG: chemotaxis-specific protein-glutamate methyltransferase CheB, partial [Mangrovicoccus sp.]
MRLLIVDDSALMRRMLKDCFADQPDIVVETARDGVDALEKLHAFQPDVITLDINMPRMDGLTCLAHIIEERPCPVIMVSSLSEKGAIATFEALELGATDYVTKPDGTVSLSLEQIFEELRAKVRAAAGSQTRSAPKRDRRPAKPQSAAKLDRELEQETDPDFDPEFGDPSEAPTGVKLVIIGSSTGGPRVVEDILWTIPGNFPVPILICQHMPPRFTRIFSERLATKCDLQIHELARPMPLEPGHAYIAAGARDVVVSHRFRRIIAKPVEPDPRHTWHPSVSRLCASALDNFDPPDLLGVMLTGMGDDGSTEMAAMHHGGARTIAESEETEEDPEPSSDGGPADPEADGFVTTEELSGK